MALLRTVYTSHAAAHFAASDFEQLLDAARAFNAANGLTGYLLFDDGHFIQALEGEPAVVDALVANIEGDARHTDFHVLSREEIDAREFGDWAMGCFHVEAESEHDTRRLCDAMHEFLADSDTGIREMLGFFRLFLRFERETCS